jgi:hypothetical protein
LINAATEEAIPALQAALLRKITQNALTCFDFSFCSEERGGILRVGSKKDGKEGFDGGCHRANRHKLPRLFPLWKKAPKPLQKCDAIQLIRK